ncbi:MAG: HDOD domain-containing protein [Candidatus Krumholzibacteriota bacterium]|nr:HDOD domain-containing protein [Candidatus Krumholzibacteriota bacterium]
MSTTEVNDFSADAESGDTYSKCVSKITDLPTIPQVLMSIWKILESPDSSSADLEKVISLDQSLSAKIIRLANSPFYYTPAEVSSVKSAIVNIGFDAVKNLVIAVSITSVFKKIKGVNRFFPLKDFWRHCVGVGIAARLLGRKVEGIDSESCFCAGILHDLGKFLLNMLFPKEFAAALSLAAQEKIFIREAENRIFTVDHTHFGSALARHWNFSRELRQVIQSHHKPLDDIEEEYLVETAVVRVADAIIRNMRYGFPGDFNTYPREERACEMFGFQEGFLDNLNAEISEELQRAGEILNLI